MTYQQRLEAGFEAWGRLAFRYRWWVIALMVGLAVGLGSRMPLLEIDTSTERFLHDDDPIKIQYNAFRDRFGRDQVVLIAIEPPEIFDLDFLRKLTALHEALEERVPQLEDITSLVNVRSTYGRGDELIVDDLLEELPETPEELAALRERVMSTRSYHDGVISRDGRMTTILIETDAYSAIGFEEDALGGFDEDPAAQALERPYITGAENSAIAFAVQEVVAEFEGPDFPVYIAGSVLLPHELMLGMMRDLPRFFLAALAIISVLLVLLFRRVGALLLSLAVVVTSLASTFGAAQLLGFPITIMMQIVPSFLLSVGVAYAVHLLAVFLQRFDAEGDREAALAHALGHSGLPILFTGLTTSAGVLSFSTAELAPVTDFGFVAAVGVAMTLLYSLVLLPAAIAVTPFRRRPRPDGAEVGNPVLAACGRMAVAHPWKLTAVAAALICASGVLASRVAFSADSLSWLPEDHVFRRATLYIDERLGGSLSLEVVIDTSRENGLHEPDVLNRMAGLEDQVEAYKREGQQLGRTISMLDIVRETHQALNENRPDFYAIPQQRQLVAQELLLFENSGSDDLERIVDQQFSQTRFTIRVPWDDGIARADFVDETLIDFARIMGEQVDVAVTGMLAIITRTARATVSSMTRSYGLALILITPLMMLLIGSLRSGLVSMIPNLTPILMTIGLMGLTGISIDGFTLMVGCVAIGLAVDDTIHFIHGFRRYLAQTGDPALAVQKTMQTTGRALLFTSLVLSAGFFVFTLSSMGNLRAFGALTGFAIATAFIIDVTVTPALLVLVSRRRARS